MDINNLEENTQTEKNFWACYILRNRDPKDKFRTYNGMTNNMERRIRQHNQEIKGGAKYTKIYGNKTWEVCGFVKGFPDKINTLQCEWVIKHPGRKNRRPSKYNNPYGRIIGLLEILELEKWNPKSDVLNNSLSLEVYITNDLCDETINKMILNIPRNIKINLVDKINISIK